MILQSFTAFLFFIQGFFGYPVLPTDGDVLLATTTGLVTQVIDGDTIEVRLTHGKNVRIRYIGIDTPEMRPYPECGAASSTARNRALVEGKTVTLVSGPGLYDPYGRRLAYVYADSVFVNQLLVAEGWAKPMMIPPNTAYRAPFEILETVARSKEQGIWNCPK